MNKGGLLLLEVDDELVTHLIAGSTGTAPYGQCTPPFTGKLAALAMGESLVLSIVAGYVYGSILTNQQCTANMHTNAWNQPGNLMPARAP